MTRKLWKSGGLLLVALATGCTRDQVTGLNREDDNLRSKVVAMGFSPKAIVDKGDRFLVEGDISFPKSELSARNPSAMESVPGQKMIPKGSSKQWTAQYTTTWPQAHDYEVNINALVGQEDWYDAAVGAIQHWNEDVTSQVHFVIVTGSTPDINVGTYNEWCTINDDFCTLAYATLPQQIGSYGIAGIGHTLNVNLGFRAGYGPNGVATKSAKMNTFVHELGHNLGFRHTNWKGLAEDSLSTRLVPGTPATDPYSVMNGGTANYNWAGFSAYDRTAIRTLWPGGPRVAAGTVDANGHPVLSWPSYQDAVSYSVALVSYGMGVDENNETIEIVNGWDLGMTSGNTFVDYDRTASTTAACPNLNWATTYGYQVIINFSDGTSGGWGFTMPAGIRCFDFTGGLPTP